MSMYVYAVGSPFENVLNQYMVTSHPIHPPDLLKQDIDHSLLWEASNGSFGAQSSSDVKLLQNLLEGPRSRAGRA